MNVIKIYVFKPKYCYVEKIQMFLSLSPHPTKVGRGVMALPLMSDSQASRRYICLFRVYRVTYFYTFRHELIIAILYEDCNIMWVINCKQNSHILLKQFQ